MIRINRDTVKPGNVYTFSTDVHGRIGRQLGVIARVEDGVVYACKWVARQRKWSGLVPVMIAEGEGPDGIVPIGDPPLDGKIRSDARKKGKMWWG